MNINVQLMKSRAIFVGIFCCCLPLSLPERTIFLEGDLERGERVALADQQAVTVTTTPAPTFGTSAVTPGTPPRLLNPLHLPLEGGDPSTTDETSTPSRPAAAARQDDGSTRNADATSSPTQIQRGRLLGGGWWYIIPASKAWGSYPIRVIRLPGMSTETVGSTVEAATVEIDAEPKAQWEDWAWSLWSTLRGTWEAEAE